MILVLGIGRSGTSWVAGICQKLGVNMGDVVVEPDEHNPKGYFEDLDFILEIRKMTGLGVVLPTTEMRERIHTLISQRKEPFGVKVPAIADSPVVLREMLAVADKVIVCLRDLDDIAESMHKAYEWDQGTSWELIDRRLRNLKDGLPPDVLEIYFDDKDKEEKIKNYLDL